MEKEQLSLAWDSALSVGITEIDDQHKNLIYYINQVYKISTKELEAESVLAVLQGLIDYTVYHFSTEDKYFTLFTSKSIDAHKIAHDKFCIDVTNFVNEFKNGRMKIADLYEYLKKWLINHIINTDVKYFKEYIEFIKVN